MDGVLNRTRLSRLEDARSVPNEAGPPGQSIFIRQTGYSFVGAAANFNVWNPLRCNPLQYGVVDNSLT